VSNIIADVIILRLAVNEASQDRGSPPVSIEQTVRGGFVTYSPERSTIMADSKSSERIRGRRSTEERGRRRIEIGFRKRFRVFFHDVLTRLLATSL